MYKKKFIKTLNIMSRESKKISWCSRSKCHSLVNDYHDSSKLDHYCIMLPDEYRWMIEGSMFMNFFESQFNTPWEGTTIIKRQHDGFDNIISLCKILDKEDTKLSKLSQVH